MILLCMQPIYPKNSTAYALSVANRIPECYTTVKGGSTMKCTVIIDPEREEEIRIYAHKRTPLIDEIEQLAANEFSLIGYDQDRAAIPLKPADVCCFAVQNSKVVAITDTAVYTMRARLYQIEENLPDSFVKINQSCIANIRKIQRFDATFGGALRVTFQNGYEDYVSRRQVKHVKERLGI
jgi:DNA-binding LytR/AlgR family response regulator